MRILKGRHAGRKLTSPGSLVRPTAEGTRDRALELVRTELKGAFVLDLFAGSGSVGLEALSRGARKVDFVENGAAALHSLKANVAALKARNDCRIFKRDAVVWVQALRAHTYDIAFVDPPYGSRKLDRVLEQWLEVPFARTLVIEHQADHDLPVRGKHHDLEGQTCLTLVHAPPAAGGTSEGR